MRKLHVPDPALHFFELCFGHIFHTSGGVNWHFAGSDLIKLSVFIIYTTLLQ